MYPNENFRKLAKIFIFAFLCSQMESSLTQQNAAENRSPGYVNLLNGSSATLENVKYLASIRLKALDAIFGEGHLCAGTIIAPSVVLTVAQCVYDYRSNQPLHPSELKVVMGTINRYESNDNTLSYGVTHIYKPKSFDPVRLRNNIAILMLYKDIPEYHPTVEPINFNKLTTFSGATKARFYEFLSWGTTNEGLPLDRALLWNVTHVSSAVCQHNARDFLCLSVSGKVSLAACPADAGAPLIHNNVLYGLSAFAPGCTNRMQSMAFTDVAYHVPWIRSQIGNGNNQNSSIWGTLGFVAFTLYTLRSAKFLKL